MRASRTLRQGALALVFLLVAACGGNSNGGTPPKPSATYPTTVPVTAVVNLDGTGSTSTSGGALTYNWVLTSSPAGSSATIASPTASVATLTPDLVGTYMIMLTVNDGSMSASVSLSLTATAYTPPTILSDIVEPLSGTVQLSLSSAQGTDTISWSVDGSALGTGTPLAWDTTTVTNGSHVVAAELQASGYNIYVSRTFQVMQTTVSFSSATISESAGVFTAVVGAQSVNGILRVDATLDGSALGSLATPNACTDPTGAACASTGPNGYGFSGSVGSGQHVVVVTATDGIGNSLGTQLRLTVTDVP